MEVPRGVTRVAFVLCGSTRRSRGGGVAASLIVRFIDSSSLDVLLACGLSSLARVTSKKKVTSTIFEGQTISSSLCP